jgi:hypothetical protein
MAGPFYFEPERVRRHTAQSVNQRIDENLVRSIRDYATRSIEEISARIAELEQESDIERMLEISASTATLAGLALGTLVDRRFYVFSAAVAGFLLLHGIQGWCPPLPVLRRAGVRTRREIDREKFALKYLRGDFDGVDDGSRRARIARLAVAAAT